MLAYILSIYIELCFYST